MKATAFGPAFSRAMCVGAASLDVPIEWPCTALCLEGDGMNPRAANASGARGMWQRMPDQIYVGGRPLILPFTEPAPPGHILRLAKEKTTGVVLGHTVWRLYSERDPVKQLEDYFAWTRERLHVVNAGRVRSREALYCCNLAPERLRNGTYDAETVLYPAPTLAYQQNARAFGLDPKDPKGRLQMKHLAFGLDAALARHRAKYDVEVTAAYAANADGGGSGPAAA